MSDPDPEATWLAGQLIGSRFVNTEKWSTFGGHLEEFSAACFPGAFVTITSTS
jgi:hypothetical protein